MAEENNKNDEPSIEEILSSIRDIISEDDEPDTNEAPKKAEPAQEKPAPAPAPAMDDNDDEDDDILDLMDVVDDEGGIDDEEEEIEDDESIDGFVDEEDDDADPLEGINLAHPTEDTLEVTDLEVEDEVVEEEIMVEEVEEVYTPQSTAEVADPDENLVDTVTEMATVGALAKLAENIAISRKAHGTTLEDIVTDLLRPLIKDWLDDNLPDLIERMVSKELERLAEKASRK